MFYFTGCVSYLIDRMSAIADGFPHSDIFGSKVARHLPEAYRRQATSFITFLESRHPPYALKFPIRKLKNHLPATSPRHHWRGKLAGLLIFHPAK